MATMQTLTVRVRTAWWLVPYLHALAFFAAISGREPDLEKFRAVVDRALKVEPVMSDAKKPCERCQRVRKAIKKVLLPKKR